MRWTPLVPALCVAALVTSCGDSTITGPSSDAPANRPIVFASGNVVVYVYWDGKGEPDKRVDIVELNLTAKTDETGTARFTIPAGDYTVRAFDINRGGPMMAYIDTKISVIENQEVRVNVWDCLPCE